MTLELSLGIPKFLPLIRIVSPENATEGSSLVITGLLPVMKEIIK